MHSISNKPTRIGRFQKGIPMLITQLNAGSPTVILSGNGASSSVSFVL